MGGENQTRDKMKNVKLFREENITVLFRALYEDGYDDEVQKKEFGYEYDEETFIEFVRRNLKKGKILEIGCGSGLSFEHYPITHAIEPSRKRFEKALSKAKKRGVKLELAVAECLPFEDSFFSTVLCIRTLFQVRSDYETLIEVNRVLENSGTFIFDLWGDEDDLVVGRAFGVKNYERLLGDFGFKLVERRIFERSEFRESTRYGFCFEKIRDFDYRFLKKLQLVQDDGGFRLINFVRERDRRLL